MMHEVTDRQNNSLRRLPSIAKLTKAFKRRGSSSSSLETSLSFKDSHINTDKAPSATDAPSLSPIMSSPRKLTSGTQRRSGLPRSSTCSNLPRPTRYSSSSTLPYSLNLPSARRTPTRIARKQLSTSANRSDIVVQTDARLDNPDDVFDNAILIPTTIRSIPLHTNNKFLDERNIESGNEDSVDLLQPSTVKRRSTYKTPSVYVKSRGAGTATKFGSPLRPTYPKALTTNDLTRDSNSDQSMMRNSSHDIIHRQLLKTIGPPQPHDPVLASPQTHRILSKKASVIASNTTCEDSLRSSCGAFSKVAYADPKLAAQKLQRLQTPEQSVLKKDLGSRQITPFSTNPQVYDRMPSEYWTGRFVSLNDRFLNADLEMSFQENKSEQSVTGSMTEEERFRQVLHILEAMCRTVESYLSFCVSQCYFQDSRDLELMQVVTTKEFRENFAEIFRMPSLVPHHRELRDTATSLEKVDQMDQVKNNVFRRSLNSSQDKAQNHTPQRVLPLSSSYNEISTLIPSPLRVVSGKSGGKASHVREKMRASMEDPRIHKGKASSSMSVAEKDHIRMKNSFMSKVLRRNGSNGHLGETW